MDRNLRNRPKIHTISFLFSTKIEGRLPVVQQNNDIASILHIKDAMNTAIEFYFPEMEYLHDTAENLFRFVGNTKKLLAHWENELDNLYDKIPPEKKVPYTSKELSEALDACIIKKESQFDL